MYILQLGEVVRPPGQNTVGVCNQITILILYYISSRLVILLWKSMMPLYKSLIFFILLLASSSSFLAFIYAFFLFLKYLLASCLTVFRLSTLLWLGSCTHCILACFLWSKRLQHSSSNHGLCHFNSCSPRLSLAEVLIISLMFSQALFMSLSSLKFSKAANLFEISIWYCFLTSSSFSFLRLNLSPSKFRVAFLFISNLSLIFQPL